MKLLLDTHPFLWSIWEPARFSAKASAVYFDPTNTRYLSYASVWEMTIKFQLGKMPFSSPPSDWIEKTCRNQAISLLPIVLEDILALEKLPLLHRDPFDRLLVAQASTQGMILMTKDQEILSYSVQTVW